MHTFLSKWRSSDRSGTAGPAPRGALDAGREPRGPRRGRSRWAQQDGFQLIEVMVSALLLGLISVGTFTGLQAVNTSNANQRFHNEAQLLASQSQEALRSDPIAALEKLVTSPNSYTTAVDGTKYTVTQSANELNGSGASTSCTATEHASQTAPNFRVTTTVSWHAIEGGHPVNVSSIVTPPTGSSLEVDVDNAPTPTGGVAGVTAAVSYTAESGSNVTLEGTTGAAGCVLFTGIRATTAKVEILEKANFVTPSGALKIQPTEVSIAPNLTTHYAVTYNEGGAIEANFTYKGKAATDDTFVVSNTEMELPPELEVGSTAFEAFESGGEEKYTAKTGVYLGQGLTARGAKYARGDLFPFPSSTWIAYAGDCAANNPETVTAKLSEVIKPKSGVVNAGATTSIEVPTSYVNLEVYKGTETSPSTLATTAYKVKITNLSCSAASPTPSIPNNAAGVSYTHSQSTTSAGVLEDPYQPFGKFELCLQATSGGSSRREKISYSNTTTTGSAFKFYPEEPTAAENTATREKQEAPAREAREKAETALATQKGQEESKWKTRETEEHTLESKESTTKTALTNEEATYNTKKANEAAEITKWKSEEKSRKITEKQRKEKEAEYANEQASRLTKINAYKTQLTTIATEKATLTSRKATEEASKTKREQEENLLVETKTRETNTQNTRIKEEEAANKAKTERVGKGTAAAVEAGSC